MLRLKIRYKIDEIGTCHGQIVEQDETTRKQRGNRESFHFIAKNGFQFESYSNPEMDNDSAAPRLWLRGHVESCDNIHSRFSRTPSSS